jgi:hypothetical protein
MLQLHNPDCLIQPNQFMKTLLLPFFFISSLTGYSAISFTGTILSENFDSLANTGSDITFTDDSTLPGWTAYSGDTLYTGTGPFAFTLGSTNPDANAYDADAGGTGTGELYSYGSAGSTERAFGSVASGTPDDFFIAAHITNDTGNALSSLEISYRGEQWRRGNNATQRAETLLFFYRIGGSAFDATGTWVSHSALDFVSPNISATTASALDGNATGNFTNLNSSISVSVPAGSSIWLAWVDPDNSGTDHGMALDDFSFSATQVPEPSSAILGLLALFLPLRRKR